MINARIRKKLDSSATDFPFQGSKSSARRPYGQPAHATENKLRGEVPAIALADFMYTPSFSILAERQRFFGAHPWPIAGPDLE